MYIIIYIYIYSIYIDFFCTKYLFYSAVFSFCIILLLLFVYLLLFIYFLSFSLKTPWILFLPIRPGHSQLFYGPLRDPTGWQVNGQIQEQLGWSKWQKGLAGQVDRREIWTDIDREKNGKMFHLFTDYR